VIRRYLVIERGGVRFGLFGVLGKEAMFYTTGAGAITFPDAIETAKEMVAILRDTEKVDVVIALSHGGVQKDKDGRFTEGDDVHLARSVPGIGRVGIVCRIDKHAMPGRLSQLVQQMQEARGFGRDALSMAETALACLGCRSPGERGSF